MCPYCCARVFIVRRCCYVCTQAGSGFVDRAGARRYAEHVDTLGGRRFARPVLALGIAGIAAAVFAAPAPAQTPAVPAAPAPPSSPGEPLPQFDISFDNLETGLPPFGGGGNGQNLSAVANGARIVWGDVRLSADRVEYDPSTFGFVASGNVVLVRGDETIRAARFTFDPQTGVGVAEQAVAVSPPFYVSGGRIERTPDGSFTATDALFTACPEGRGELRFAARTVETTPDGQVVLRNARVYLYGTRLFSLRVVRQRFRGANDNGEQLLSLPLDVRVTRASGLVIGPVLPFTLGGWRGEASAGVATRRRSLPYRVNIARDLLGSSDRDNTTNSGGGGLFGRQNGQQRPGESPLRAFLRARTPPALPDPILDFENILPGRDPLELPTRVPRRELQVALAAEGVQDVTGKRRAPLLLLSRLPEAQIAGAFPLGRVPAPPGADLDAARAALRRPRVLLGGNLTVGRYTERSLSPLADREPQMTSVRAAVMGEIGLLPLLAFNRLLVRPRLRLTLSSYDHENFGMYRVAETDVAANYVLGLRSFVGLRYLRRFTSGQTPFVFDEADTRNEAQFSAQTPLGAGGRYTVAALLRYDPDTGRTFDYEVTLALRGRCIEPRLSYRKLGGRLGFSVVFPGLTSAR